MKPGALLLVLLAVFALAISIGGWVEIKAQQAGARRTATQELAAIADLKVGQIAGWVEERRNEADLSRYQVQARQLLADPGNAVVRTQLLEWMSALQHNGSYRAVVLCDARGAVQLAAAEKAPEADDICALHAPNALHARDVVIEDLRNDHPGHGIHLVIAAPIGIKAQAGDAAVGVLLFVIDPQRFLYPLVQTWPTPSPTAETLLIRREGNDVLYLNELRHRKDTALTLRLPIDPKLRLPAALAVEGQEGEVEGVDYREFPALAAIRAIPGTPWFMVAKVDLDEVDAPSRQQAWSTATLAVVLLLAAGLGVAALWRQQKLDFARQELAAQAQAQAALRESENRYARAVRGSSDGLWEWNIATNHDYLSPRWKELLGFAPDELADHADSFFSRIHPDDVAPVQAALKAHLEQQAPYRIELRLRTKRGDYRWFLTRGEAERDAQGQPLLMAGSITDIDERKHMDEQLSAAQAETTRLLAAAESSRAVLLSLVEDQQEAEQKIRLLNATLERRVAERTADLEAANADLEGFSYSISHDLRAPLRAIDGFSAILLEDYAPKLDAEGLRLFGVVQDNARKMSRLIDDILAFSRAGRQDLECVEVDMNALVDEVWASLAEPRGERNIEFRRDDLPGVVCDPRAIRQVWANLLGNAVKFSRDRDPAIIEVAAEARDGSAHFTVRDNGVGFNPEYAGKLFGLFQRLHGMDEFEGTGLGLAIVKRFVQKHGGSVAGTGQVDAGATFRFSLPTGANPCMEPERGENT